MNGFKVLLILSLILYFFLYERDYVMYFYLPSILIYAILSEFIIGKNKIKNSKLKFFMNMWKSPYDPQIYSKIKVNLNKTIENIEKINKTSEVKIGLTAIAVKVIGNMSSEFKLANSSILFGKLIQNKSVNVSIISSISDKSSYELITINEVDCKSLEAIQKEINQKKKDHKTEKNHFYFNETFIKNCPTL